MRRVDAVVGAGAQQIFVPSSFALVPAGFRGSTVVACFVAECRLALYSVEGVASDGARPANQNASRTNRTDFARVIARCCASVRQFVPNDELSN
jgi:hypothetical protein